MRLGLVTCVDYLPWHPDDAALVTALAARGVEVASAAWDADVDWRGFDLVLIRTPWDYFRRIGEFLPWLDALERCGARVANPVPTLRWNTDKRYLEEMASAGVPVVDTILLPRTGGPELAQAIADAGTPEVVVKPAVSGGAWRTLRLAAADVSRHAAEIDAWRAEGELLVQPYLPEIASAGEWSVMFFDGVYSHAVLKRPRTGDFRVQQEHGGGMEHRDPPAHLRAAAQRCMDALVALGHGDCLYARVDGVEVQDQFRLMEMELIEPQLFFTGVPAAAGRFAAAIHRRLTPQPHRL